ncbi:MAG TPA: peptidoglycan recognition family protein [Planctomycetia bacterium]|nr:peptidoglycan recognition family protein [Planctomycetia bacterium]
MARFAPAALIATLLFADLAPLCAQSPPAAEKPGARLARKGDEIAVCGQLFHTTAPVVLWTDEGGYDAYRVERRFADLKSSSWEKSASKDLKTPNRYGARTEGLTPAQIEKIRGGGWSLPMLQDVVDQFVLHFDVCGTSKQCFKVLHDARGLSVHFMLDLDGTIYQTLDLKERAWHATISNTRSIGIEIANIGAYSVAPKPGEKDTLAEWYQKDESGKLRIVVPKSQGPMNWRPADFVPRPRKEEPVVGEIQGKNLRMYDLTPQQYDSLVKLSATLCKVFPKIKCDYPRGADGKLLRAKLPDGDLFRYQGILGHYHIQTNKTDPGPALDWDYLIGEARKQME